MQAESRMRPRVAGPDPEFLGLMPDYLAGITLRGLAVICADLDGKRQTFLLEAEHVAPHRVPLDLTVASVDRFTMAHQTCTFRELLDGDATTEQLVVTFLAMLELAKRGSLTLSQDEIFGTICINRVEGRRGIRARRGPLSSPNRSRNHVNPFPRWRQTASKAPSRRCCWCRATR